jgi:predicted ArsR family transcriptional regulator
LQTGLDLQHSKEGKKKMSIPNETRRERYDKILLSLTARQKIVLAILKELGDLTAQEVADTLCFLRITPTNERNFSAPRLTELCDKGLVVAVRKKICKKTGRTVTVWSAVKPQKTSPPSDAQIQFELKAWLDSLPRGGGKRKQNNDTQPPRNTPSAVLRMKISM